MGGLWTTEPIPGGDQRVNFTAHWGGGVRLHAARRAAIVLAYRFQHISNGNQLAIESRRQQPRGAGRLVASSMTEQSA